MSAIQNPTVMFVHGAWHRPKHFERISNLLNQQGFPTSRPALASVGGDKSKNLYDDAKVVRSELDRLIVEEQKDVIVVLHSYGGIAGTQAVDVSLSKKSRKADGRAGGVLQLVYMTAFMLPLGKQAAETVNGELPAAFGVKDGLMDAPMPYQSFYHDLSDEDKATFTSYLGPQAAAAFVVPLTYVAWKDHPVSYIFCEDDKILPPAKQHSMVTESGIESTVRKFQIDSSHSPFLSKPQLVVDIIKEIAEESQSK